MTFKPARVLSASFLDASKGSRVLAAESDAPDDAAGRLEAALERIARGIGRIATSDGGLGDGGPGESVSAEVAPRLDRLIARLRAALGETG